MITFDPAKCQANIAKHGLDFAIAEEVLAGFTITREDRRGPYGEVRLQSIGLHNGVVVVVVVHAPRGEADHIISIRKAESHETRYYWKNFPG
jgi:uncharacterized DUF497 family protein